MVNKLQTPNRVIWFLGVMLFVLTPSPLLANGSRESASMDYFKERWGLSFQDIFGGTPLERLWPSITRNRPEELSKIVREEKIDVNLKGKSNITILHWIIGTKNHTLTEAFLQLGADPNTFCYGDTGTITLALMLKDLGILKLLGQFGAHFNDEAPSISNAQAPRHPIARVLGTSLGPEFLEIILSFGADPNFYKEVEGARVFEWNFLYSSFAGADYSDFQILLNSGADPNISTSVKAAFVRDFRRLKKGPIGYVRFDDPEVQKVFKLLKERGVFKDTELE